MKQALLLPILTLIICQPVLHAADKVYQPIIAGPWGHINCAGIFVDG